MEEERVVGRVGGSNYGENEDKDDEGGEAEVCDLPERALA